MNEETENKCGCSCSAAPTLIFSCSGAADVGELSDRAARQLTRDGKGKMFCLAGIGGRVSGIMKSTEAAESILAIDGCPLHCAKKCLEQAGFQNFKHIEVTALGFTKGKTPITDEAVSNVVAVAENHLNQGTCS
ncbi:MAG: putative zinc-binding protein [Alphaproteobacteria bacterium]|nr:putative zinc-binding protein [Alphaproteobacteria bacterium]